MKYFSAISTLLVTLILGITFYMPLMNVTMEGHHHHDAMESCLMSAMPAICPMLQLGDFFSSFGNSAVHAFQVIIIQLAAVSASVLTIALLTSFFKLETAFVSLPPPRWRTALARGLIHPKSY